MPDDTRQRTGPFGIEAAEAKHGQSIAMAAYDQFAWFKREIMTNDARSSTLSKLAEAVAAGPVIGDGLVLRAAQGRVPPDEERAPKRSNAGDHSRSPPSGFPRRTSSWKSRAISPGKPLAPRKSAAYTAGSCNGGTCGVGSPRQGGSGIVTPPSRQGGTGS